MMSLVILSDDLLLHVLSAVTWYDVVIGYKLYCDNNIALSKNCALL